MYSYPEWIVQKYIDDYGYDFAWDMVSYQRAETVVCIRANTLKISKDELIKRLEGEGISSSSGRYSKNAIYIRNINQIEDDPLFREGFFTVQGEASMLVCEAAPIGKDEKVLDLCAAPGGKSAYIKELSGAEITAFDVNPKRAELMDELFTRLGLDIETGVNDATVLREDLEEAFDTVIVDAPCSALGLLYRKPDIKHGKKEEDLKALAETELLILENAARYVKKGGQIIYSTCTIDKTENADVIRTFLERHKDFASGELSLPSELKDREENGTIQLFPHIDRTDGFFIARAVKNG